MAVHRPQTKSDAKPVSSDACTCHPPFHHWPWAKQGKTKSSSNPASNGNHLRSEWPAMGRARATLGRPSGKPCEGGSVLLVQLFSFARICFACRSGRSAKHGSTGDWIRARRRPKERGRGASGARMSKLLKCLPTRCPRSHSGYEGVCAPLRDRRPLELLVAGGVAVLALSLFSSGGCFALDAKYLASRWLLGALRVNGGVQ